MKDTALQFTQDSLRKFVGIPHEKMDCYELVQYFYEDVFGVKLEKLYGQIRPSRQETETLVSQQMEGFKKVETPRMGDIILIKMYGLSCHIAIYIDEKQFLHSREGVGSSFERSGNWEKRIEGYYRCLK